MTNSWTNWRSLMMTATVLTLISLLVPVGLAQQTPAGGLNIVGGTGTPNFVPVWTGTNKLGNSVLYQSSGKVGIGTQTPGSALDVAGDINITGSLLVAGTPALQITNANTAVGAGALNGGSGQGNSAFGYTALLANGTGMHNTALGEATLTNNHDGSGNVAVGSGALFYNASGSGNVGIGASALAGTQLQNVNGGDNVAIGGAALMHVTTGLDNIGIGYMAMIGTGGTGPGITGSGNIAIGQLALPNVSTGTNNVAIGSDAGGQITTGSNNIIISNTGGVYNGNGAIIIGTPCSQFVTACQSTFFVAGVSGVQTLQNDAVPVLISSGGQLGTMNSSRRYKEDIQDMADASDGLMKLRPVTFRYQKPFEDGSQPIQYGLIAEEVAEVYPDLVAHSADGQIEAVKYQVLDSMLLNEVQRQQKEIRGLEQQNQTLVERLARLEAAMTVQ